MWRVLSIAFGLAIIASPGATQQGPVARSEILTVEPERLIAETAYGRSVQGALDARAVALLAENRKIDADLEAEERALTERRALLPADEFRALAEVFDTKVETIRTTQEAKGRALTQEREAARQQVLAAAVPVLAEILTERGASAILDKAAVIIAFDRNDVTDAAILRLDAILPVGAAPQPAPGAVPKTDPAPVAQP